MAPPSRRFGYHGYMQSLPIVMTFAGHDPCGGAGIQADIETLASQGCRDQDHENIGNNPSDNISYG